MATKQIDEYYESLAYWKQQALDHEQELRDIKYNTIMNITAEVEQLKAENLLLKDKLEYWRCTPCEAINDANKVLNVEIQQLKSKLEIAKKGLEFYAGGDKSDIELDIFDHFKCHHNGNSEFDSEWLCKPARQALSEIGEG